MIEGSINLAYASYLAYWILRLLLPRSVALSSHNGGIREDRRKFTGNENKVV